MRGGGLASNTPLGVGEVCTQDCSEVMSKYLPPSLPPTRPPALPKSTPQCNLHTGVLQRTPSLVPLEERPLAPHALERAPSLAPLEARALVIMTPALVRLSLAAASTPPGQHCSRPSELTTSLTTCLTQALGTPVHRGCAGGAP